MHRLVFVSLLLVPLPASAQIIKGTVIDSETGTALKAANIRMVESDHQRLTRVVSNDDGKFELVIPKGKTVYLEAEHVGYRTVRSTPITAQSAEELEIKVRMNAQAVALNGIDVVARKPVEPRLREFVDRASLYKRAGVGHIWTRSDLEKRNVVVASRLLSLMLPTRPALTCSGTSLYIDDVASDYQDIDLLVAPEELEGVEIYRDTEIPADLRFKSRGTVFGTPYPPCTLVMLWRKPYTELNALYASWDSRSRSWPKVATLGLLGVLVAMERAIW